ncbi:hypothetical protein ABZ874_22085 [Streptomyces albidoflavus]|uniref:hypothetical protein n=1 Tax=Streptomyces albidoflavus TaxID=1886 RepID=UPI0033C13082
MPRGSSEDRAAALTALREVLGELVARTGCTRKDIVARSEAAGTPLGATTISQALNHGHPAPTWRTVAAIARALRTDEDTLAELRGLWRETQLPPDPARPVTAGEPGKVRTAGPGLLEVHQALMPTGEAETGARTATVTEAGPGSELLLTPYLTRPHDHELRRLLAAAVQGRNSALVILTGDSSTGKTRALYEALLLLTPDHRLWRPTRAADLAELLTADRITPGTVLWLNEAQRFFYGDRAEEAAAALRELLMTRTGIVAVGTLWTFPYWEELVRHSVGEDPRSHARALLESPAAHRIQVPAGLTGTEQSEWKVLAASSGDRRMDRAGQAGAIDGRVVQHLSGGPQLLNAYRMGPGAGAHFTHAEHALVTAAVAARQAGHHAPLSKELLTHVAHACLPPRHRPTEPGWAGDALAALTTGVRTDGTRTDIRHTLTALVASPDEANDTTAYEPADYLQQNLAAASEAPALVPALWDAMTIYVTDPFALMHLSYKARTQGFTKQAVLLLRRAIAAGYPGGWLNVLTATPKEAHARQDMALWFADNVPFDTMRDVFFRMGELRFEGDRATGRLQARAVARVDLSDGEEINILFSLLRQSGRENLLLDLDPVSSVRLSDEYGVFAWLNRLVDAGYVEEAGRLVDRINGAELPLENPSAMRSLIAAADACAQSPEWRRELAMSAAKSADVSGGIEPLLDLVEVLKATSMEAAGLLALRTAASIDPEDTASVAFTLDELRHLGMTPTCRLLAEWYAHTVALADPEDVGWLMDELANCGFDDLIDTVLARDPLGQIALDSVTKVTLFLWTLARLGQKDVARSLALNSMADLELDDAEFTSCFLDELASLTDSHTVKRFASYAAEEAPVTRTADLRFLISSLRRQDLREECDRLVHRAVREADLRPEGFVSLLRTLRDEGLDTHAESLVERAVTHKPVTEAAAREELLLTLRSMGEDAAADRLKAASTPAAAVDTPAQTRQTVLPQPSPYGLETDGTPARPWTWREIGELDQRLAAAPARASAARSSSNT